MEPADLSSLLDAMARRYGGDYRVIPHLSALGALAELERLKNECERVALIITDHGIPHGFYRADSEDGSRLIEKTRLDPTRPPAVVLLDGHVLSDPTNTEIMDALGTTDVAEPTCDLVIVGGGPAGLASAVYASSFRAMGASSRGRMSS